MHHHKTHNPNTYSNLTTTSKQQRKISASSKILRSNKVYVIVMILQIIQENSYHVSYKIQISHAISNTKLTVLHTLKKILKQTIYAEEDTQDTYILLIF